MNFSLRHQVFYTRKDISCQCNQADVIACRFSDCTSDLESSALFLSSPVMTLYLTSTTFLRCQTSHSSSALMASCLHAFLKFLCFFLCESTGSKGIGDQNSNHAGVCNMQGSGLSQTEFLSSSVVLCPSQKVGVDISFAIWYSKATCSKLNFSSNEVKRSEMFTLTQTLQGDPVSSINAWNCTGDEVINLETNPFKGDEWNIVDNSDGTYLLYAASLVLTNAVFHNNKHSHLFNGEKASMNNCFFCENQFDEDPSSCVTTFKLMLSDCNIGTLTFFGEKKGIDTKANWIIVIINE